MDIPKFLDPIFKPRTIAVIGASTQVEKWGHRMVARPSYTGFRGMIYPVNPNAKEVAGLKAFPTIADLPQDIDLAVFTLPAPQVPQALRKCLQHGNSNFQRFTIQGANQPDSELVVTASIEDL